MVSDIERLGDMEIILKCDGEPAMNIVQEQVTRRRMDPTILENSVTGFSRSKTVARACASTSCRLQERFGGVIRSSHPVITWLVQHAADCISKYWVSEDGKSAHE